MSTWGDRHGCDVALWQRRGVKLSVKTESQVEQWVLCVVLARRAPGSGGAAAASPVVRAMRRPSPAQRPAPAPSTQHPGSPLPRSRQPRDLCLSTPPGTTADSPHICARHVHLLISVRVDPCSHRNAVSVPQSQSIKALPPRTYASARRTPLDAVPLHFTCLVRSAPQGAGQRIPRAPRATYCVHNEASSFCLSTLQQQSSSTS